MRTGSKSCKEKQELINTESDIQLRSKQLTKRDVQFHLLGRRWRSRIWRARLRDKKPFR